jgi:anti-anti-sigma regulatory factor
MVPSGQARAFGDGVLRITPSEKPTGLELMLEGRLEGPWVEVLRKTWTDTLERDEHPHILVDLGSVSFADPSGRALLRNMQDHGVGLMKASLFLREMLKLDGSSSPKS